MPTVLFNEPKSATAAQAQEAAQNVTPTAEGGTPAASRRQFFAAAAQAGARLAAGFTLLGAAQGQSAAASALPATVGVPLRSEETAALPAQLQRTRIDPAGPLGRTATYVYGPFPPRKRVREAGVYTVGTVVTFTYSRTGDLERMVDASGERKL